jgi:ADP-heptose:LPS heptosyltransferase
MLRRNRGGSSPQTRFRSSIERNRLLSPLFDILIHPGANADNRKWPVEHFVELITLLPTSCRVGLVGLPEDIEKIRSSLPDSERVQCLVGSLEEAIVGIARTRVLLSMDSGTTFFAKALRVPTVALYGPVDPVTVVSRDEGVQPIYERRWACQPCGDSRCRYSVNYCMRAIEPDRVAHELLRLLQGLDQKVPVMMPADEERHASDR